MLLSLLSRSSPISPLSHLAKGIESLENVQSVSYPPPPSPWEDLILTRGIASHADALWAHQCVTSAKSVCVGGCAWNSFTFLELDFQQYSHRQENELNFNTFLFSPQNVTLNFLQTGILGHFNAVFLRENNACGSARRTRGFALARNAHSHVLVIHQSLHRCRFHPSHLVPS